MKNIFYIIICCQFLMNCATNIPTTKEENTLSFEKNDEDEYDLMVMDPQYDIFLKTIARPENFYSEEFYKNRNRIYVNEWNLRNSQPFNYDPNFYTLRIDYDSNVDYGINLEYKLYNFFEFLKWKYKVDLNFGI